MILTREEKLGKEILAILVSSAHFVYSLPEAAFNYLGGGESFG